MDAYTVFKFKFTYEVWIPLTAENETITYEFLRNGTGLLMPGTSATYLYAEDPIIVGLQLRRIRDPKGNVIFGDIEANEYPMYTNTSDPIFDYHGVVRAYGHMLRTTSPVTFRGSLV